ncbi:flagellar assembly peptidoglycan hydrolase FlgJ [Methylocaldum sp.]|uniref:flagellar assembly peptidoglycan hydrolase FlgJ n=1 Tax=Methylocaldum sp. TaxID=1969727 RepID=UPI002D5CFEFE|nr:flagellar assembly peptidoglycan hydrolase FlgJ [Methylocaldum sp.]HYE33911.1 flagellar assembly peptidoglycan hydrolase FlgJ [Methylocaldum sp.]
MIKQTGMADVYTDFKGTAQLKNQAKHDPKAALGETARQFESLFIQMALKSMREAVPKGGLMDGKQSQMFRDMYDQQLAVELGKRSSLGFSDMLVQQLGGDKSSSDPKPGMSLDEYRDNALPRIDAGPSEHMTAEGLKVEYGTAAKMTDKATARLRTAQSSPQTEPFANPKEFVTALWPHAQEAAAELGVDPKLLLAQAALETGWGKTMAARGNDGHSHNLFGIKADRHWTGQHVTARTLEYADGIAVRDRAAFRAYNDYAESFRDYVNFLKTNPRYAAALEHTDNPRQFMASLQKAGYATDPNYARKVLSIYEEHRAFETLPVA